MSILLALIKLIFLIIQLIIAFIISVTLIQVFIVFLKVKKSRKKYYNLAIKYKFNKHFKLALLNYRFLFYIEFLKWVIYDIFSGRVHKRLFGIWCFTGYFGQGKTAGAVNYALKLRKEFSKMGLYVHIYTNFNMRYQDGRIKSWEDLLNLPKRSIVIFDEIQSTFTSQKFKDFPIELLWKITQCRKQELMVLASSPVFSRMSIQLRENTDMVICCKNIMNSDRWFNYKFYRAPDYERFENSPLRLFTVCQRSLNYIPSNRDFSAYNTTEIVDRFDISQEEKPSKKITQIEIKAIENNLRKFVEQELKKIRAEK